MAAYMIVNARISDREKFMAGYAPAASKLVEQFGGRYIVRTQGVTVLEGKLDEDSSVVISEWPDKAAALRFWNSPEYAEVRKLRQDCAECLVMLIEAPLMTA
ncbi:MAG: DUF1330 domain-containing protein [Gammaproteobacteria bacterium]